MSIKQSFQKNSIKGFVLLWMSGLVICFFILAVSLIVSTRKLQTMNKRIFSDSRALKLSHQLEILILAERHEDLLWRETQDLRHYQQRNSKVQEAERLLGALHNNATSAKKRELFVNIQREFEKFKVASMPDQPVTQEETNLLTNNLLQALENFREQNHKQMH
jgi:hypothetical protein